MYYLCDNDILIKDILLKIRLHFKLYDFESIIITFYLISMSFGIIDLLKKRGIKYVL